MESKANIKMVRVAPRKARLVIDLIRSKQVEEAFHILDGTPNKAAFLVKKLLNSAVANATHNHGMTFEHLFVKVIKVDEGPIIKRFHPRARGRAMEILKRTSHISVIVSDDAVNKGKGK